MRPRLGGVREGMVK